MHSRPRSALPAFRIPLVCGLIVYSAMDSSLDANPSASDPRPEIVSVYDIRDFGAIGDGRTLNTEAVQAAINQCHEQGGGRVLVAGGDFVIGTIRLRDHVVLRVEAGAVLLGSTDIADYAPDTHKNMYKNEPHMDRCLIFARGATGFGIEGNGTIDGRGGREHFPNQDDPMGYRPMMIRFLDCEGIRMRDITLRNPAAWTSAWLYCRDIVVDGITIESRANGNGDGLDFDGCENVRVSNSAFDTSDDSICLQASRSDRPCRNITISNCVFVSKWAGMRIGLLSRGDFEEVTVTNCVFRDIEDSGLKIQMCEGGVMKNMVFSNLVMHNVPRPIFMTFGQQRACVDTPGGQFEPMDTMRGFTFSDIRVDSAESGKDSAIVITGMPGHPIEEIRLSNIDLVTGGGGTTDDAATRTLNEFTPEVLEGWWPEYTRFGGTVPAHGIYARHVKGLSVNNVRIEPAHPDLRPAVVCDDAEDLDLNGLRFHGNPSAESVIRLQNARQATVRDCRITESAREFVLIEGGDPATIVVTDSNLEPDNPPNQS